MELDRPRSDASPEEDEAAAAELRRSEHRLRRLAEIVESSDDAIISTDLAHTHEASGRYGFDPAAAECDAALLEVVRADTLDLLLEFDEDWVDRAKNEAIRPLLTLHGLLEGTGSRVDLLSYEAPTYYGMMCAAYDQPASAG